MQMTPKAEHYLCRFIARLAPVLMPPRAHGQHLALLQFIPEAAYSK